MQYDLSIIIPARHEEFLKTTVENILQNKRAKTEIIVVLDGRWSDPPLVQHPDVNVIYVPESIGQRAAINLGVKLSRAKYVMKMDAHVSIDEGCDTKMIEGFKKVGDNVTLVPIMKNLWAFDWKCTRCGWKQYQGPTPKRCPQCGDSRYIRKKMMWVGKHNPQSVSYCFDSEPHFQYFEAYKHREPYLTDKKTGFTETMSLQGSCFMVTRQNYWDWEICDESLGSWGSQGIECSLSTWTTGHRVVVNHSTWYAHLFRTSGGDFSFPYPQSGRGVQRTKQNVKDKFWNMKHPKQKKPVSFVVERFWPIPGWTDKQLKQLKESEKKLTK